MTWIFRRGRRGLLRTFVPKGKPTDYYDKTRRGLEYITPPTQSPEADKSLSSHSPSPSEWESNISVGVVFKILFINMNLINQLEQEEAIETFDNEPWAQQLDLQWEKRFEQLNCRLKIG